MLKVSVKHAFPAFNIAAAFESDQGITALFGRSGAGKSSIVQVIAGLLRPDEGRVELDGEVLLDTKRRIAVPTHRRRIGYVFQEGRLFPHLSVAQNLKYGAFFAGRRAQHASFGQVVDLLGLGHLASRAPASLSGGEKQRVAIGRALLAAPRLLLMDEPLASLDEGRKGEILPYLERLRDEVKVPIVYVSHSIGEVARLATTLVLLSEGRVAAYGPTPDVMSRLDLFPLTGRAEAGALLDAEVCGQDTAYGLTELRCAGGVLQVPAIANATLGEKVRLRIRARDVMLAEGPLAGISALNVLQGVVEQVQAQSGPVVDVRVAVGGQYLLARITRKSLDRLRIAPGRAVSMVIKSIAFDRRAIARSLADTPASFPGDELR